MQQKTRQSEKGKGKKRILRSAIILLALFISLAIALQILDRIMTRSVAKRLAPTLEASVQAKDLDGTTLRYRTMGEGEEVLLLVHGFLGSSYDFRLVMPELAQRYTVYAVDQIGFGLSDKSTQLDYRRQNSAALLASLMQALDIESYHVLGHSMGGQVALHLALAEPQAVESLILVSSAGLEEASGRPNLPTFLIDAVFQNYGLQRLAFYRMVDDPAVASRENFDRFFYFNRQIPAETLRRMSEDAADSSGLAARLEEVDQSVLLIWGREDRIIPWQQGERLDQKLPQSQLVVLENCGHLPFLEKPQALSEHALQFLP